MKWNKNIISILIQRLFTQKLPRGSDILSMSGLFSNPVLISGSDTSKAGGDGGCWRVRSVSASEEPWFTWSISSTGGSGNSPGNKVVNGKEAQINIHRLVCLNSGYNKKV